MRRGRPDGAILLLFPFALAACGAPIARSSAPPAPPPIDADEHAILSQSREIDGEIAASAYALRDEALERYLTGVARRLLPEDERLRFPDLAVKVALDPDANAFALAHGAIWVNTGTLSAVENEAQLAMVLGHELAHVRQGHPLRAARNRSRQEAWGSVAQSVVGGVALMLLGQAGVAPAVALAQETKAVWVTAAVTGYSRDLEREADEEGFAAVRAAGYDVGQGPRVLERLEAVAGPGAEEGSAFFATHPLLDERIASHRELAGDSPKGGEIGESPFRDAVSEVLLENARLEAERGRTAVARDAVKRHLAWRSDSARGYLALGDVERSAGRRKENVDRAMAAYARAAEIDPSLPEAHRELGYLLREQGDEAASRAAFERYLALAPEATDAPLVRGMVTSR